MYAAEPLLRIGQPPAEASFLGASGDGTCQFRVAGQTQRVSAQELVRWSTARVRRLPNELILTDGTRLVLAEAWTGQQPWQLKDHSLVVTTKLLGKVTLPREQVGALVLNAPSSLLRRTLFLDPLLNEELSTDRLCLTNGDQWTGQLLGRVKQANRLGQIKFRLESTDSSVLVAEKRVAAIVLGKRAKTVQQAASWGIGLRDGSLLMAKSLVASEQKLLIGLPSGLVLTGSDARDVAHLRSLSSRCVYLSDLVAADFRHEPYLELLWPYRTDRNVLNGPLQVADSTYAKGLGMLTAARLTYRLDTPEIAGRFQRFVATLAIDDAAAQRGSVLFRVYLEHKGKWQQAYASPVVRGGDPPIPVKVELRDAQRLALVTDFADRGAEGDYANWIEARLESSP